MPKKTKSKSIEDLRHNEYYETQKIFDDLYARSTKNEVFEDLMDLIVSEDNILLAYRNIKGNGGSKTPGTDGLNIDDIARLTPKEVIDKVRYILIGSQHGYRPKPVRRKEIPKPNGSVRPLGIPCIWDRLIQQSIKQVLEPICEAKFSDNSFGFRPIRSVEHAIAKTYRMIQNSNLYHVIEFDIKGFFDNVDHRKLIKQIWAMGIHDKKLIWIIKQILKGPIKLENGSIVYPDKGTPQGGIISPLLANIVLNELDQWVESQWTNHPVTKKYSSKSHGYRAMKESTNLKEMRIVRYADDFRIFCRSKKDAEKVLVATTKWLKERLKLDVSPEKTRIIDVRSKYMEFLGFKIRGRWNYQKHKYVIESHISDKALEDKTRKLVEQIKRVCSNPGLKEEVEEITLYNSMVLGIQNYYRIATNVARDLNHVQQLTYHIMYNRLNTQTGNRLVKRGRELSEIEKIRYGRSKSLRFVKGSNEPIYPIYFVQHKTALSPNAKACIYTEEGRRVVHDKLETTLPLLYQLRNTKPFEYSIEMFDNRISLYSAQKGKCYVMEELFENITEIHCHHKEAKCQGGKDNYENLVLVKDEVHKLIHANKESTILSYLEKLNLKSRQLKKLNYLRFRLNKPIIKEYNLEEHILKLEKVDDYIDI